MFGRISWNDGQNEILSFTDIDRSVSGGFSIKGSYWEREADTIGFGAAINGLSAAHRDFLVAGGLGLLIGDGRINYRTEKVFEAYYAYSVNKSTTLTLIRRTTQTADPCQFFPVAFTRNFRRGRHCSHPTGPRNGPYPCMEDPAR